MSCFKASDIFDVSFKGNFPLDVLFTIRNPFKAYPELINSGIYTLTFKNEPIYIGSYSGKSNVAEMRWQNELQTHSMRGFNVGFTPTTWITLQGTQQLSSANFPSRVEDTGFQSSKKRVLFAEEYWDLLSQNPDKWLSNFSFIWMPVPTHLKRSKKEIEKLTKQLRNFYKPRCNG